MLSIDYIRENKDKVIQAAKNKGVKVEIDRLLGLDDKRRSLIKKIQEYREERNKLSKQKIADEVVKKGKELREKLKNYEEELKDTENEYLNLLYRVPNVPLDGVPIGKDETGNVVIRKWGKPRKLDFKPKDHVGLGKELDLIDLEKAGKISGSRFYYLKNELALLEFALISFVFKTLTDQNTLKKIAEKVKKGYDPKSFIPVVPPAIILPDVFVKMARLDEKSKDDRYYIQKDNIYLIGSAEHTLGPLHMDETLSEKDLPIRYLGFSTNFRREAGSYGKDVRGIFRVHQFDKIEMESFTIPEASITEQDFFVSIQEYLMQVLEIPYQVVMICTGDMALPDARQIDIEAWLPGQERYRETHTSDLTTDYQSRRLNTKVRRDGKSEFVHMNDATAFAIGRTLITILENYQQKDGSVAIPKVLQPFVGFEVIKRK